MTIIIVPDPDWGVSLAPEERQMRDWKAAIEEARSSGATIRIRADAALVLRRCGVAEDLSTLAEARPERFYRGSLLPARRAVAVEWEDCAAALAAAAARDADLVAEQAAYAATVRAAGGGLGLADWEIWAAHRADIIAVEAARHIEENGF